MTSLPSRLYHRLDGHMREVVRGAGQALFLKVGAMACNFLLYVAVARFLPPTAAGLFFLALTLGQITATLGRLGLDNSVVRFVAAHAENKEWGIVRAVYHRGLMLAIGFSTFMAGLLWLSQDWLALRVFGKPELAPLVAVFALATVPFALFTLYAHLLKGLKQIAGHVLVLSLLWPLFTTAGIFLLGTDHGAVGAAWSFFTAAVLSLGIGVWLWRQALPASTGELGAFPLNTLLASCIPLFWVAALQLILQWFPTLLLGVWANSEDVGVYSVANRTALLMALLLLAVNSISAPKFAALYHQGNLNAVGQIARQSALLISLASLPLLCLFLFFPEWVLSLFGPNYREGAWILRILAVGQFINVITGSVGYVLMMSGHETAMRNIFLVCALVALGLNSVLVPQWGITGAAIAAAITLTLQNGLAAFGVWRKLRIITLPGFQWLARATS